MNFKPLLIKFFQDNKNNLATDLDYVRGWYMAELDFNASHTSLYFFVPSVKTFCHKKGHIFYFNWKLIEEKLGVKYEGIIHEKKIV